MLAIAPRVERTRGLTESQPAPMIEITNLAKTYGKGTPAIHDISLTIREGEFVVLLGPSGVGKSTLLRCLNYLVEPTSGDVRIAGRILGNLSKRELLETRRHIGMIFQEFNLVNRMSVLMNVACGKLGSLGFLRALFHNFSRADRLSAVRALNRAGLQDEELYLRRADTLSGGQKQRVAIARTLMQEPRIILADEPVASLDVIMQTQIMDVISEVARKDGITVVMSLHQLDLARKYATRIVALNSGRVAFDGPPENLSDEIVNRVFARPTLAKVDA